MGVNLNHIGVSCNCCGKPLSDRISVDLGIGPVCRVKKKEAEMGERTGNMFAPKADYEYDLAGDILWIIDRGGYKSVTNDMENILREIGEVIGPDQLRKKKIMYRDSMQIWDGVRLSENGVVSFFPLTERDSMKAREKLLAM
jgi:hypothetical protein